MPSTRGIDRSAVDLAVPDHPDRRRGRGGELVQPVVAAEDQRPRAARRRTRRPCTGAIRGVGAADRRAAGPGRVGQRTEEVEDGAAMPSSRRGTAACRMPGWNTGAKQKPMPDLRHAAGHRRGRQVDRRRRVPPARRPRRTDDDAARLPCLTTGAPAAAATTAAMVEMFTVCAPSPPVPTMSTQSTGRRTGVACASIVGGQPGDLLGGLALGPQRDREAGHLRRGGLAGHHLAHRPGGVGRGRGRSRDEQPGQQHAGQVGRPGRASRLEVRSSPAARGAAGPRARAAARRRRPGAVSGSIGCGRVASASDQLASQRSGLAGDEDARPAGASATSSSSCRRSAMPPVGCASPSRMQQVDAAAVDRGDHLVAGGALDPGRCGPRRRRAAGRPPCGRRSRTAARWL